MTWLPKIKPADIRDILLSSLFYSVAFQPSPFAFFIYIAFIPQLILYQRNRHNGPGLMGYYAGLVINGVMLYWLIPYSPVKYLGVVLINSLQFAVFGMLMGYLYRLNSRTALIGFPVVWTSLEFVRQYGPLAFNWLNIAYTHNAYPYLIQFIEYTGYLGIVFWILMVNMLLLLTFKSSLSLRYRLLTAGLIMTGFAGLTGYSAVRLAEQPETEGIYVTYLQPDIDSNLKWQESYLRKNLDVLTQMTAALPTRPLDIVLWPETALPFDITCTGDTRAQLRDMADMQYIHLITGFLEYRSCRDTLVRYNSVAAVRADGDSIQIYRKLKPVPVEESPVFTGETDRSDPAPGYPEILPGESAQVFELPVYIYENTRDDVSTVIDTVRVATVICFESLFPQLVDRFYENGARILVILTNDGWFGRSAQPYQHFYNAALRAVEHRSAVVQCANTGVSGFFDPYGRVLQQSDIFTRASARRLIPLKKHSTVYENWGEWFGITNMVALGILLLYTVIRNRHFSTH